MRGKVERSHLSAIRLEGQCFLSVYTCYRPGVVVPTYRAPTAFGEPRCCVGSGYCIGLDDKKLLSPCLLHDRLWRRLGLKETKTRIFISASKCLLGNSRSEMY